jgi:hypothetical protein
MSVKSVILIIWSVFCAGSAAGNQYPGDGFAECTLIENYYRPSKGLDTLPVSVKKAEIEGAYKKILGLQLSSEVRYRLFGNCLAHAKQLLCFYDSACSSKDTCKDLADFFTCKQKLEIYLNDSSPSIFSEGSVAALDHDTMACFLDSLWPCIQCLSHKKVSDQYRNSADSLIANLFVIKRGSINNWIRYLKSNHLKARELAQMMSADPKLASEITSQAFKSSSDSGTIDSLIKYIGSITDPATASKVFESILKELSSDPEKRLWLKRQIDDAAADSSKLKLIEPFMRAMEQVHNEKMLLAILTAIQKAFPAGMDSSDLFIARAMQIISTDLEKRGRNKMEAAHKMSKVIMAMRELSNSIRSKKPVSLFIQEFQPATDEFWLNVTQRNKLDSALTQKLGSLFSINKNNQNKPVFNAKEITVAVPGDTGCSGSLSKQMAGAGINPQPDLLLAGTYNKLTSQGPVLLTTVLVDVKTNTVLWVYSDSLPSSKGDSGISTESAEFSTRLLGEWRKEQAAQIDFDIFAGNLLENFDVERFRSFVLRGMEFDFMPFISYDSLSVFDVQKIFIEKDFFTSQQNKQTLSRFVPALMRQIQNIYPQHWDPELDSIKAASLAGCLQLSSDTSDSLNGKHLYVVGKVGHIRLFRIGTIFSYEDGDSITDDEAKTAASISVGFIEAFLRLNQRRLKELVSQQCNDSLEKLGGKLYQYKDSIDSMNRKLREQNILIKHPAHELSYGLVLAGFAPAGIPQIIHSDIVNGTNRRGVYLYGTTLFGLQICSLVAAGILDYNSIVLKDNKLLWWRNGCFYFASALNITSAIHYWSHLSDHKKKRNSK